MCDCSGTDDRVKGDSNSGAVKHTDPNQLGIRPLTSKGYTCINLYHRFESKLPSFLFVLSLYLCFMSEYPAGRSKMSCHWAGINSRLLIRTVSMREN